MTSAPKKTLHQFFATTASLAGVRYIEADVSTAAGCSLVADQTLAHFGGIDVLVNVIGGSSAPPGGFAALSDEQWRKELDGGTVPTA